MKLDKPVHMPDFSGDFEDGVLVSTIRHRTHRASSTKAPLTPNAPRTAASHIISQLVDVTLVASTFP